MGAEVVKLAGDDVAAALLRFAKEKGGAMIILGRTHRSRLHRMLHGSVVNRVVEGAGRGAGGVVRAGGEAVSPRLRAFVPVLPAALGALVVIAMTRGTAVAPDAVAAVAVASALACLLLAARQPRGMGLSAEVSDSVDAASPGQALSSTEDGRGAAVGSAPAERRADEDAAPLAAAAEAVQRRLEEIRLPLHVCSRTTSGPSTRTRKRCWAKHRPPPTPPTGSCGESSG
jgi:hypothetical protein